MIEQLFGSKTRVKLLKLFFSNPNRSFYVREITRKVEEQINSVRRELGNLLSLGLITSDSTDHKLYYEVNQEYEHYDALRSMFSEAVHVETSSKEDKKESSKKGSKTKKESVEEKKHDAQIVEDNSIELPEAQHWNKAGNITGIAYSGAYTRDESAGVDILVIGDALISKVESVVAELEKEKHRELRYALIEEEEWQYRRQVRDKFWLQFMSAKKQIVLDKNNNFTEK